MTNEKEESGEGLVKMMTVGYKFSKDVFISTYLLDKWGIKYEDSDLEDGPWGRILRIKDGHVKKDS